MITAIDHVLSRFARIRESYEEWERRQVASRLGDWSVRRRLLTFVLLPLMLLLCCGAPIGIPALVFVRETVEAGRGSPAPDAAANEYLMALSYATEDGLLPLLDNDRKDDLLEQWRAYLAAMQATEPPPFRLDFSHLDVGLESDRRTEVRIEVKAVWSDVDENGRQSGWISSPRTWLIETHEDDGWRVSRVNAPSWCGTSGYVLRCPGNPAPAPTSAAPSASPSTDLLQHPREMLRCGKRDPFREMHSCPPASSTPSIGG